MTLTAPTRSDAEGSRPEPPTIEDIEPFRSELTGFCYRMLGSVFEAEDAVQDTMVRAWKSADGFQGRSSLRSWLYRIATNVCLDALNGRNRRARPMDLQGPGRPVIESLGAPLTESTFIEPVPDRMIFGAATPDPAEVAALRDSVRLAFLAALQHLPPRQRAVLILRDVLRWSAAEVAELLDTTVASANSALQRARATLSALPHQDDGPPIGTDDLEDEHRALLERYVDAFERYDMAGLVALLHEDATQNMPPFSLWLRGRNDLIAWYVGPGAECEGSVLRAVQVNGLPGFAQYRRDPQGGWFAWAIQVLELRDGRIAHITSFLDTKLFALFGLPERLPAPSEPQPTEGETT